MTDVATVPIIIIGSGLAGYTLARELRRLDPHVPLRIVSRDDGAFYSKPMLSNGFSARKQAADLVGQPVAAMREQLGATIDTHATLQSLDLAARRILVDGEAYTYGRLVLALGAEPVQLPLTGSAAAGVLSVNDLADYERLQGLLKGKQQVVILGAGLIGCEFANDLCNAGYAVHVVDISTSPLARLIPSEMGALLQDAPEAVGVVFHLGATCVSVDNSEGSCARYSVLLNNGRRLQADAIISAVGLRPRTVIASAAGLSVVRGIVVDRELRTSDPNVYALGDCAEVCGLVLPYVAPIMQAARALARTLSGTPTSVQYPAMPVLVKTPALPLVVAPPQNGADNNWQIEGTGMALRALCRDALGGLNGFALSGAEVAARRQLATQISPWLPPMETASAN